MQTSPHSLCFTARDLNVGGVAARSTGFTARPKWYLIELYTNNVLFHQELGGLGSDRTPDETIQDSRSVCTGFTLAGMLRTRLRAGQGTAGLHPAVTPWTHDWLQLAG